MATKEFNFFLSQDCVVFCEILYSNLSYGVLLLYTTLSKSCHAKKNASPNDIFYHEVYFQITQNSHSFRCAHLKMILEVQKVIFALIYAKGPKQFT
jgi:hypothetical protein